MHSNIQLQIIDDKFKVITPYNEAFVKCARDLHGKWRNNAWWFDDTALDMIREILLKLWNTTGETPYENCCLRIKNYTRSAVRDGISLFNRGIARAFSRGSDVLLGEDIIFISGKCKPGGTLKQWTTELENATFEIRHFPLPATMLPEVQQAIAEGWCEVISDTSPIPENRVKTISAYQSFWE